MDVNDGTEYQLCANFKTDSQKNRKKDDFYRRLDQFWDHAQGRHCYTFSAKKAPPELYDHSR